MDAYGIFAEVLYPNVSRFGAGRYTDLRRYGSGPAPVAGLQRLAGRVPAGSSRSVRPRDGSPFWDIDLSIAEMARCADMGHEGIIFSQAPEDFGAPTLSDPHWDKLWAAAQEMQLSVNFHIGSGNATMIQMLHPVVSTRTTRHSP